VKARRHPVQELVSRTSRTTTNLTGSSASLKTFAQCLEKVFQDVWHHFLRTLRETAIDSGCIPPVSIAPCP
jgi:hypothetical protein